MVGYATAIIHKSGRDKLASNLFRIPPMDGMKGLFFFMDTLDHASIDYSGRGATIFPVGKPVIDPVAGAFASCGLGKGFQTNILDMANQTLLLIFRTAAAGVDVATRPTLATVSAPNNKAQIVADPPLPGDGGSIGVGALNSVSLSGRRHFDPASSTNGSATGVTLATNLAQMKAFAFREDATRSTIWDMTTSPAAPTAGQPGYAAPTRPIRSPNDQYWRIGCSYGVAGVSDGPSDIAVAAIMEGYQSDAALLGLLAAIAPEMAYRGYAVKPA